MTINFNPKGNTNRTITATDETSNGRDLKAVIGMPAGASTIGQGNFVLNSDVNTTLDGRTTASDPLHTDGIDLRVELRGGAKPSGFLQEPDQHPRHRLVEPEVAN